LGRRVQSENFLQEKAVEATKQKKEERRKKPKPEEQEGMSCPKQNSDWSSYTILSGGPGPRWHAFLFLGLRFFPLFFFLLGGLHCFFLVRKFVLVYPGPGVTLPVKIRQRAPCENKHNFLQEKESRSHQAERRKEEGKNKKPRGPRR
jgi:hypothetical protein